MKSEKNASKLLSSWSPSSSSSSASSSSFEDLKLRRRNDLVVMHYDVVSKHKKVWDILKKAGWLRIGLSVWVNDRYDMKRSEQDMRRIVRTLDRRNIRKLMVVEANVASYISFGSDKNDD